MIICVTIAMVIIGLYTGYRLGFEQKSKAYIGLKRSVRFKNIIDGRQETTIEKDEFGNDKVKATDSVDRAYCFDYAMLRDTYGINLEVVTGGVEEDYEEPRPEPTHGDLFQG